LSTRYAIRYSTKPDDEAQVMSRYMPSNFNVSVVRGPKGRAVLIAGEDSAGWTLDGYVIPRLASGLYHAREITADEVAELRPLHKTELWAAPTA
jgi:hypothetical protein